MSTKTKTGSSTFDPQLRVLEQYGIQLADQPAARSAIAEVTFYATARILSSSVPLRSIESPEQYLTPARTIGAAGARTFDRNRAKLMIREALASSPGLDELDVSQRLDLGFQLTCELIDELVGEGAIERSE